MKVLLIATGASTPAAVDYLRGLGHQVTHVDEVDDAFVHQPQDFEVVLYIQEDPKKRTCADRFIAHGFQSFQILADTAGLTRWTKTPSEPPPVTP